MEWHTEKRKLSDLKSLDNNPRTISKEAFDQLTNDVDSLGNFKPLIIDIDNTVIGGNQRLQALIKLGIEEIECSVPNKKLTEKQRKEIVILDNQHRGEFDIDMLANEYEDTLKDLGYDDLLPDDPIEVEEDDYDISETKETSVVLGDIWQLGSHKLMCGDSTSIDQVEKLMNGQKADMVFTDPPYGVDYDGGVIHGNKINVGNKREALINDDKDIYKEFMPILNAIINDGAIYIFYATRNTGIVFESLKDNEIEVNSIICWNKVNTGYADMNSHYKNKYEPCLYAKRKGMVLNFRGSTSECTVWDIEKDRNNKFHPTQKPIAVPARAIGNSSLKGEIVLDLFGGSGSTLIACEQLNRKCYMMELDPHYCQVIIDRWEKLTGLEAERIITNE